MNTLSWLRFTWDLGQLPDPPIEPPKRFSFRLAVRDDREMTTQLIKRAFGMDTEWYEGLPQAFGVIDPWMQKAFELKEVPCLLLCDGSRAVGASLLHHEPAAENHLISGPCISSEYRSRKLGTLLFDASLRQLQLYGVGTARGVAKEKSLAARWLYPRYGAQVEGYPLPAEED